MWTAIFKCDHPQSDCTFRRVPPWRFSAFFLQQLKRLNVFTFFIYRIIKFHYQHSSISPIVIRRNFLHVHLHVCVASNLNSTKYYICIEKNVELSFRALIFVHTYKYDAISQSHVKIFSRLTFTRMILLYVNGGMPCRTLDKIIKLESGVRQWQPSF